MAPPLVFFPSADIRQPDFGDLAVFGSPSGQFFSFSKHTSPFVFTSSWFSSAYAGAGLGRRSSIGARTFWNEPLGTATSANWNVTYRPMADHLGTDLDQFFPQRGQRPMLGFQRECPCRL